MIDEIRIEDCIDTALPLLKPTKLPARRRNRPVTLPHRLGGSGRPRQRLLLQFRLLLQLFSLCWIILSLCFGHCLYWRLGPCGV